MRLYYIFSPRSPFWTINTTTYSCYDSLLAVSVFAVVDLIVKMIMREVSQLQRICYFRDYSHVSCIDRVQQQLAAFSKHMIMWSVYAWYCSRRQLQLAEEMSPVFQLWSCARRDKALLHMIAIPPHTVQRLGLCLKFDMVAN